jgi:hypothetical protein
VTNVKSNQAPLTITSTSGTFGTPLTLTTNGGSGTGAVTYALDGGGSASGCSITSGALSSTSAGTCIVTATKAMDSNYNPVSSSATTITLNGASITTHTSLSLTTLNPRYGDESEETFHVNVSATSGTPTGTVTITSSAGTLCTATLLNGTGTCSLTNRQLPEGTYTGILAIYNPTGGFAASSSSTPQTIRVR